MQVPSLSISFPALRGALITHVLKTQSFSKSLERQCLHRNHLQLHSQKLRSPFCRTGTPLLHRSRFEGRPWELVTDLLAGESTSERLSVQCQSVSEAEGMEAFAEAASAYEKPKGLRFAYGTAGFRAEASTLASTVFRAGVLAALRSQKTGGTTGLMVTASHNPVQDNGVKLADPSGGMLAVEWESEADEIANALSTQELYQKLQSFAEKEGVQLGRKAGRVFLARDTRPSGSALLQAAIDGVRAGGAEPVDLDILTTPQLHWIVRAYNRQEAASEEAYFQAIAGAYRALMQLAPPQPQQAASTLVVDGANGVGASKVQVLAATLEDVGLKLEVRNTGKEGEGELNNGVGADYVQKERQLPNGFEASKDQGLRCVSFDGDADRLVYFYLCRETGHFHLLDGDKIATLAAVFVGEQLAALGPHDFTVVVVQTAYANGASTRYIKGELGLAVAVTPTGVKHLHARAHQDDVGVYFEANGHGTVLFSDRFVGWLKQQPQDGSDRGNAVARLLALEQMVNQAVGDALSGLLLVEAVLRYRGWGVEDWGRLYVDLPSRQTKVKVADRAVISTADAETRAVSPAGLQDAINAEVAKVKNGRSFVRPSGTEDVVRVYAEAASQGEADALATAVAGAVHRLAGGVGPHSLLRASLNSRAPPKD